MVDCLIERRTFHADRLADSIASIVLYTDSSPVTGEELQGMCMDVTCKDNTYRRSVLPGASIGYGLCNAIQKAVPLLWALFLVAGPDIADLRYCLDHVIAITTDGGVELSTLMIPDILVAFLKWCAGGPMIDCRPYVDYSQRLFRHALRIIGWGHSWGNVMSSVCKACPKWTQVLESMRCLVSFFTTKRGVSTSKNR